MAEYALTPMSFAALSNLDLEIGAPQEDDGLKSMMWDVPTCGSISVLSTTPSSGLLSCDLSASSPRTEPHPNRSRNCPMSNVSSTSSTPNRRYQPYPVLHTPPSWSMGDPFSASEMSPVPLRLSHVEMPDTLTTVAEESRSIFRRTADPPAKSTVTALGIVASSGTGGGEQATHDVIPSNSPLQNHSRSSKKKSSKPIVVRKPPALQPVDPAREVIVKLTTYRWNPINEFVYGCPVVEVRPYNKADGKRYVYLTVNSIADSKDDDEKRRVRVLINHPDTGDILGLLQARGECDIVSISVGAKLTLRVSEEVVKQMDTCGIGRGAPLHAHHVLELVLIEVKNDDSDGSVLGRVRFFRIKRRSKKNTKDFTVIDTTQHKPVRSQSNPQPLHRKATRNTKKKSKSMGELLELLANVSSKPSSTPSSPVPRKIVSPTERDILNYENILDFDMGAPTPKAVDLLKSNTQADAFFHPNMRGGDDEETVE